MTNAPQSQPGKPEKHALERPIALAVFLFTSLLVAPYNWFFVVGKEPLWVVAITSIGFLYGAALTSIPAGAALKRFADTKIDTPRKAILIYTILLLIFVGESIACQQSALLGKNQLGCLCYPARPSSFNCS